MNCSICGTTKEGEKLGNGWKRKTEQTFCPDCWRQFAGLGPLCDCCWLLHSVHNQAKAKGTSLKTTMEKFLRGEAKRRKSTLHDIWTAK